ncbi:restriction endonuclease [Lacticaseibacillus camelliae]|nr:restriction endonuclease [Lacticaseibacillus camelliae]
MKLDYRELKLAKDGVPTWDAMLPVLMSIAMTQKEWLGAELKAAAVEKLNLPQDLRELQSGKRQDVAIENRTGWALSDLSVSGLLERPRRGVYRVTELGKSLFQKYGMALSQEVTHAQPNYKQHKRDLKRAKSGSVSGQGDGKDNLLDDAVDSPSAEQIGKAIDDYNSVIAVNLLERIREAEPVFFERLVIDLLNAMGYQGTNGTSVLTPSSGDGGIDGIINQDPLGTQTVYVQAKRYAADNIVQRPQIDQFYGALSRVHGNQGVFITTSGFSSGAKAVAKTFSIVLIDGIKLTSLMLKYHVGVQQDRARKSYELLAIDEDYFDN